jgi:hypothetical protein
LNAQTLRLRNRQTASRTLRESRQNLAHVL